MAASDIVIQGAREHNLQAINLVLPRNQLICFTGVSGSGKSSLAFDTLYAEGQRRYVESLSTFARQFIGQMAKPNVDRIEGLSPSICISQKTAGSNPRSTVGTITEIYDYLRILYARAGTCYCPQCGQKIQAQPRDKIIEQILETASGQRVYILAPLVRGQKGEHRNLFASLLRQGFSRARIDGEIVRLEEDLRLRRQMRHDIELVVDRLTVSPAQRSRLAEAVENALKFSEGEVLLCADESASGEEGEDDKSRRERAGRIIGQFSSRYTCPNCKIGFPPPSPQLFSFNSPEGMCPQCQGLGRIRQLNVAALLTNPRRSIQQGCFEFLGKWRSAPTPVRTLLRRMAEWLETRCQLEPGTVLETAWEELPPFAQNVLMYGVDALWDDRDLLADFAQYCWEATGIADVAEFLLESGGLSAEHRRQVEQAYGLVPCFTCGGSRLRPLARAVRLRTTHPHFADAPEKSLPEVCALPISEARLFFTELELDAIGQKIAEEPLKEIRSRLEFLGNVGLDYLTLDRSAPTLSGGEMQRIRLAGQIGSGLVGVTYILDEPSIGLHPRDNDRLLATLARLRDQGNTVVVVEHDEDTMRAADCIVDFGPGPGSRGGRVVAMGDFEEVIKVPESLTGQYLSGRRAIPIPTQRRSPTKKKLVIRGARHNNLKNIDVEIPLGLFVCVTGVSGSGKSSLVSDILVEALNIQLNGGTGNPGVFDSIEGLEYLDKMIAIDQSPIGRTPRSNPATYIKVFDDIRKLFADLPESRLRGYKPGRFSFNVPGGRCESCEGNGATKLEMDFLADIWVTCPVCEGKRFNRQTLQIRYKGKNIADVLEMDVREALELFENIPPIRHKLETLQAVGLDYMKLGQPSPTLSGGEAQRIKLARELTKRSTGKTIYILDEPTTGLHFADIELLLKVLHSFVDAGNTVIVVEHNLEVIKTADWIIDLGPEGGDAGGYIVATGTPEEVAQVEASHTGRFLRHVLAVHTLPAMNGKSKEREEFFRSLKARTRKAKPIRAITIRGARQHNLKGINVEIPRDQLTVCCGRSGSGKSSLAMDTVYAEGQRRYVESLSTYARQFVSQMQKPKVDHVEGLSPAIAIEQKHAANTPRSTVGTVTEIYDYFRVLMARLGQPYCPQCGIPVGSQAADQIIAKVMAHPEGTRLFLLAPLDLRDGGDVDQLWDELRRGGFTRVRVDGIIHSLDDPPRIDRRRQHAVEVVVDRVVIRPDQRDRIAGSVEMALSLGDGVMIVLYPNERAPEQFWKTVRHSQHFACEKCGRSFEPLSPNHFSFNSPLGWCPGCEGLGKEVGADPAALVLNPKATLREQALAIWPTSDEPLSRAVVETLCRETGIPLDVPWEELSGIARRLIFHGTGERWFDVWQEDYERIRREMRGEKLDETPSGDDTAEGRRILLRFQYKGLYPTLETVTATSPRLRAAFQDIVAETECTLCGGSRLRDDAAAVRFRNRTIDEWCRLPLGRLLEEVRSWQLTPREQEIAGDIVREIASRVQFLVDVGLDYLTLARSAPTLSGGESQRIRLAAQVGSGLCGVLYVLDEPTIGLHPRDNHRLLAALRKLRDLGNTLLVVEHDREVIQAADHLLDFGPEAGDKGGEIVAQGRPTRVARSRASVTGPYLSGKKAIFTPSNRRMPSWWPGEPGSLVQESVPGQSVWRAFRTPGGGWLEVHGARHNNLKNISVAIPLGTFTVITGVSGSGKSSLVEDVLYSALARHLHRANTIPGEFDRLQGVELINKVIRVDQQPLGQTPTSTPATYTGVFDKIRDLFAQLPEAKRRGFTRRRFSFNVPGGRCEKCEGAGQIKIEMHFLPDVWVECDACHGRRYDAETLAVTYHGKSISDVLDMPCEDALELFKNIPEIRRILQVLCDVGLGYLKLGQPANTLSGGEAQRVKLAAELARPDTGRTLYLLDEPTTGLHFDDLSRLLDVLQRLVDLGNTVVVIEHNLDVIKSADWIIDLGPEAGEQGGYVVVAGTPEDVVAYARWWQREKGQATQEALHGKSEASTTQPPWRSYTGEVLASVLENSPRKERKPYDPYKDHLLPLHSPETEPGLTNVKSPWEIDGRSWHLTRSSALNGRPIRWDRAILERLIQFLENHRSTLVVDYSTQNVIEVRARRSRGPWFMHIYTGDDLQLRLRIRTGRGATKILTSSPSVRPVRRTVPEAPSPFLKLYEPPQEEPPLPPPSLATRQHGVWCEIDLRVSELASLDEINFWDFLAPAMQNYQFLCSTESARTIKYDLIWHLAQKGITGRLLGWRPELLGQIVGGIKKAVPEVAIDPNHKSMIMLRLGPSQQTWAVIYTKKSEGLWLVIRASKNRFPLGRLRTLWYEVKIDGTRPREDRIQFFFTGTKLTNVSALGKFFREAADAFIAEFME
ncbi:MAG: excinuclease ABC subunit UvrA [Thermogutta sp.]